MKIVLCTPHFRCEDSPQQRLRSSRWLFVYMMLQCVKTCMTGCWHIIGQHLVYEFMRCLVLRQLLTVVS